MLTTLCPACHRPVPPNVLYCTECGADVREVQSQAETVNLGQARAGGAPRQDELLTMLREATLGEYEILGELGRGGMATVFLATDMALERRVAIKVMSPMLLYGEGMVERFKREARTAGGLSHPHIIPIHAVRETERLLFLVMKYVDGRSIDQLLKDFGPMSHRMVQEILAQVGNALQYAHRRQIVHRDVKPANIMLDEDGWAVVTDFGIAKVENQSELTKTGSAVGTPYYMSPEQCNGRGVGPASDQYSLGIVAYEMLTGRVPFPGPSIMEVMRCHFLEPPPPIERLRPDCPATVSRVIMRMLAKEPADRFPTVDDAVRALGAAPLDANDPLRTQMVELARSGPRFRPRVSVPVSPIPLPRRPPSRTPQPLITVPASRRAPPAPPRSRTPALLAVLVVSVLATAGGLIWWRGADRKSPSAPGPVTLRSDSQAQRPVTSPATPVTQPAPDTAAKVASDSSTQVASDTTAVTRPSVQAPPPTRPRPTEPKPKPPQTAGLAISPRASQPVTDTAKLRPVTRQDSARVSAPPLADSAPRVLTPTDSWIAVWTRVSGVTLYVNGREVGPLGSTPQVIKVKPGGVKIRATASGCDPIDLPVTVAPGDTLSIGRLNPTCTRP